MDEFPEAGEGVGWGCGFHWRHRDAGWVEFGATVAACLQDAHFEEGRGKGAASGCASARLVFPALAGLG